MGGDFVLCSEVTGQTPDFLTIALIIKDEIPIVVLAVGIRADIRLQAIV